MGAGSVRIRAELNYKNKMKPKWLQRNASCPSCGVVISELDYTNIDRNKGFDCLNCKDHWSYEDFWEEQHEKNGLGGFASNEKIFSLVKDLENEL